MKIAELNQLAQADFVAQVGWVFEHSPWVAARAWTHRPFDDLEHLHSCMTDAVAVASIGEQLELLRAHPDLGARARMSESSVQEQAGAGLDQLTPVEFTRLHQDNEAYKTKFG